MASILNTLNLKLQQAQEHFHEYSSSIIEGLTTGNIKPNVNKKLSIISYWLEMLQNGIPSCELAESADPLPISITITSENFHSLPGELGCALFEYFWTRNVDGDLVPLAKVGISYRADYDDFILIGEPFIRWSAQNASLREGFKGGINRNVTVLNSAGNEVSMNSLTAPNNSHFEGSWQNDIYNFMGTRGPYNNADGKPDDKSVYYYSASADGLDNIRVQMDQNNSSSSGYTTLNFSFKNVGAKYNEQKIQTTNRFITIDSPIIRGGRDASFCPSLTDEQINCYSKILDYIAIELGFNYVKPTIGVPNYASIISNDNNLPITLEDGSTLDSDDSGPENDSGGYPVMPDPPHPPAPSRNNNRSGNNKSSY